MPIAGHFITKNDVERELETALFDFQSLPREKFRTRIEKIAKGSGLDPSTVKITVDETGDSVSVTIRYQSSI